MGGTSGARPLLFNSQSYLFTDNALDYDLALSIAPYLGIKKDNALEIVKQIKSIVAEWRKVATRYGIPKSEQDLIEDAFRY